jgi:four helix bundle protein
MKPQPPRSGLLWISQLSERISKQASCCVQQWPGRDQDGIGDQLIRASDSIGLNFSEGYARSHNKERLHFFSMAQGSVEETLSAVRRARDRNLLTRLEAYTLSDLLIKLSEALRAFSDTIQK